MPKISFIKKKVSKPVKVKFTTKKGRTGNLFIAKKKVAKPVRVKFYTKSR